MKEQPIFKSFWSFLPLLLFYIVLILIFSNDTLFGDEIRHMRYATNISNGFYTHAENPEFANGPGYPLVITPFTLLNLPYICYKFLNAVFLILAVVYFFKTLSFIVNPKLALGLSYVLGLYPPVLKWMVFIYSECLALFLICGFLYYFLKTHAEGSKRLPNVIRSAIFVGFLALTKVIFGYVILAVLAVSLLLYLKWRARKLQSIILIFAGAFLFCVPYLIHTYTLTGKPMYWGTQGGKILYWRASPFPNEYGDWISEDVVLGLRDDDYFETATISKNHRDFFEELEPYTIVQRDEMLKEKAVENMKKYPLKYLQNTGANVLRLFFNYPFSYTQQKITSYYYILPNGLMMLFLLSAVFISVRRPSLIPFEVRYIGLVALIYMGGLILLNGRVRHLIPAVPILLYFIIFVLKKGVYVKLSADSQS